MVVLERASGRQVASIIVGLTISIAFAWLAIRGTNLQSILSSLSDARFAYAPIFLTFLTVFCLVKARRWASLLEAFPNASTTTLLPTVLIGYFGTAIMPMQLGELLRAHTAASRLKSPFVTILSSLAVERIFDVLGLVSLISVLILAGGPAGYRLWITGAFLAVGSLLLIMILVLAVAKPKIVHAFVDFFARRTTPNIRSAINRHTDYALNGMAALKKPSRLFTLLALSTVQWIFMVGCVWASLQAVSIEVPFAASLAVLAATVIGMMLPAGPGYFGTFQLAFIVTLSPFGIESADALAASLFYHVFLWVPLSVAGLACLRSSDLRLRRMLEVDSKTGKFRILHHPEASPGPDDPRFSPERQQRHS